MAPIKFEENIKDKLEKRTLKPSTNAWNSLSERLDNNEKKDNKKSYWWLGIAASVIGVLFIVSQFLNDEVKVDDTPQIVNTKEVIENKNEFNITVENKVSSIVKTQDVKPAKESVKKIKAQELVKSNKLTNQIIVDNEHKVISKEKSNTTIASELPKKTMSFEDQKIQDIVAQVQSMKKENKEITEADIDALLKAAQKELKQNRLYNETTHVVDANALLQDVEAELDQSFRTKVFEALKSSYNSVKTAVAQRNE